MTIEKRMTYLEWRIAELEKKNKHLLNENKMLSDELERNKMSILSKERTLEIKETEAETAKKEFTEAIAGIKEIKEKYNQALKEIEELRTKYNKDMKREFNKIRKQH